MQANIKYAVGPTILMGSGIYFDYLAPDTTPISIEDYAYGLAFECRFRGQCISRETGRRVFYSVAQHAVIASYQMNSSFADDAFEALMHESGEPVCGDMVSPLKAIIPEFKAVEKRCEHSIGKSFGVKFNRQAEVKAVDLNMWATERRDLMNWDGKPWSGDGFGDGVSDSIKPYPFRIIPVGPEDAATQFLNRWRALGGTRRMVEARRHG